jgi:hypothetical protein
MSHTDTSIALMVNRHALFGVNIKIALAWVSANKDRLKALREHKAIIIRRESRLGEGARKRNVA